MKNPASKCTFISSTSVYGDCNDNVTEETDLKPESEGGRQLVIVEAITNSRFKTTVLRFGGLIGEEKSYILAGRKTSNNNAR
jgi:nucleoside-diphosphate-sugar epimerase